MECMHPDPGQPVGLTTNALPLLEVARDGPAPSVIGQVHLSNAQIQQEAHLS